MTEPILTKREFFAFEILKSLTGSRGIASPEMAIVSVELADKFIIELLKNKK
jgi:hypothetical protein